MALVIKTRAEIIQDIVNAIKNRDTAIETGFGPVKDIVIDPVSLVSRDLYTQIKHVFDIQFLQNAESMSVEELDLLGESFGITRKGPVRAVGSVFFVTASRPTANITIPSNLPIATSSIVGVKSVQSFVTTKTATLFASSADAYFNPSAGVFEIEVPVRALIPGAAGLVAGGTITTLQRQIPGISAVTNKSSTTGGKDAETNTEYARRIRLVLLGTDRGTSGGLRRFALNDDRVVDALVVMAGDELMVRAEDVAGAVDVYILGNENTVSVQTAVYDGLDIVLQNEPAVFPTPVSNVTGSIVGTLAEGTHFFIIPDVTLAGSARAVNILRWNRAASGLPSIGESISVEYTYDKLISDLQDRSESPDNHLLADVLFRRSTQVDIQIEATIKATADVSLDVLDSKIRSAIKSFVNTRGLGEDIVPSDLDLIIRSVSGVDFVFLPFDILSVDNESGSNIISIASNEYAQISDTNIVLNIST